MHSLEQSRKRRDLAEGFSPVKIPKYGKDGTAKHRWRVIPLTLGCVIIFLGLLLASVHIPVLLHRETPIQESISFPVQPDEAGVRNLLEYARDHPGEDFDSDGLSNTEENTYGTDPRNPDTDGDGISDYAEIYLFNTRPGEADSQLETLFSAKLDGIGMKYSDPYRIHDVILWADSLHCRSTGTVVPTLRGFRFSNFSGWAQFPGTVHAYLLEDDVHKTLEWRETENAWRIEAIDSGPEIALYSEPLPSAFLLTAFNKPYILDSCILTDILSTILPREHSFLTCREVFLQDLEDLSLSATVTGREAPETDLSDLSRFGECTNELSSLTSVYSSILSGRPVPVSLQSASYGECLMIIYGFTEYGDLILCEREGNSKDADGNPYLLDICEKSAITVDQTGEIRQREFFDFNGLGFSSLRGDKIHFLIPE